MPNMLSIKSVAERLSVKPRTVLSLIQRGLLRAVRVGHVWRIHPSDVEFFLDSNTTK